MTAPPHPKIPHLPFILLGLMTTFSFGGPLAIGYVLRGGASPTWPPDRPVEWFTFGVISGMVFGLMMGCLSLALMNRKAMKPRLPTARAFSSSPLPLGEGPGVRGVATEEARPGGSNLGDSTGPDPHPGPLPGGEGGRSHAPLPKGEGGRP
jgi:hypothetical protein